MELWTINKVLRYTGWRLAIEVDATLGEPFNPVKPTKLTLVWYGWGFLRG